VNSTGNGDFASCALDRIITSGVGRPKRYFDLCITGGACCRFGVSSGITIHVGSPPRTKMRFPILPPLPIAEAQTTVVCAQAYTFAREVNMSHIIDGIVAFGIIAVLVICGLRNKIYS